MNPGFCDRRPGRPVRVCSRAARPPELLGHRPYGASAPRGAVLCATAHAAPAGRRPGRASPVRASLQLRRVCKGMEKVRAGAVDGEGEAAAVDGGKKRRHGFWKLLDRPRENERMSSRSVFPFFLITNRMNEWTRSAEVVCFFGFFIRRFCSQLCLRQMVSPSGSASADHSGEHLWENF